VHVDEYDESNVRANIEAYDTRRNALMPYRKQRRTERFGQSESYGWSEEKARHYGVPERADFGAFIREKKFRLD
jgi:nitroreductase/FMN reductase [NAD(P)H]